MHKEIVMRTIFRVLIIALGISAIHIHGNDKNVSNMIWEDDFKSFKANADSKNGWVLKDITVETIKGTIIVREAGASDSGYLIRSISIPDESGSAKARYLQIMVSGIENIEHSLTLQGVDATLYTGINTFDIRHLPRNGNRLEIILQLKGPTGKKPGGWVKVDWVKLVHTPYDGMTIDRDSKNNLIFRYHSENPMPRKKIPFQCFVDTTALWMCKWTKGPLTLCSNNDKTYCLVFPSKELAVKKCENDKNNQQIEVPLIISGEVDGKSTYGFSSFKIPISINLSRKRNYYKAKTPMSRQYRSLWEKRTSRENLALGRKVKFSVKPNYRLTNRDKEDEWNLTDGELSRRLDDRIWFSEDAVGWISQSGSTNILVDLGKSRPIGKVVVRVLCGGNQGNLLGPAKLEVALSENGKDYYKATSLARLMPGEKEQCDWERYYYLEETGKPFVYPFELNVNANARYVGLKVDGATNFIFLDEMAVLKATPDEINTPEYNKNVYTSKNKTYFIINGILLYPLKNKLVISTNINTPNFFKTLDTRSSTDQSKKISWVLELPEEITILKKNGREKSQYPTQMKFVENNKRKVRWTLREATSIPKEIGPVYLQLKKDATLPKNATAVFYALTEGCKPNRIKVPIRLITIPKVKKLKKLHNSLAWMSLRSQMLWPGFFDAWECLGFNYISCFPRYWDRWKETDTKKRKEFMLEARNKGYKLFMNESPFHVMMKGHKPGSEIYSVIPGKKSKHLCPSYRGKYYKKELERVAAAVEAAGADYVIWDIECWYHGAREATSCARCQKGSKESNKPLKEYLTDLGREINRDLYQAVKKGAESRGIPMPVVGSYNRQPLKPIYHLVGEFKKNYPDSWNLAMPALYIVGRAQEVHNSIRENHKLLGNKRLIPWLTAGCYGEFPSRNIEAMVLESLLNGAKGTTYYKFSNFETPLDYYYHAKAYAQIAPYEDLVVEGDKALLSNDNPKLTYSALRKDDEMLILVGNYAKTDKIKTKIELPFKKILKIKDLREEKTLPLKNSLILKVQPGDIRLIYVKGK